MRRNIALSNKLDLRMPEQSNRRQEIISSRNCPKCPAVVATQKPEQLSLTEGKKGKGVKVGFLHSATYTANQNSALHNLGSGSSLAIASGAAALCGLSTARANVHWTRGCSQINAPPPQSTTPGPHPCKLSPGVTTSAEIAAARLLLTIHLSTLKG